MSRRLSVPALDAPDRGLAAFLAWLTPEVPPSMDRWIAKAVREGAPALKRSAVGAELSQFMDAAVSWGVLVAFLPFLRKRSPLDAVPVFCDAVRGPGDLLKLWRRTAGGEGGPAFAERVRRLAAGGDEGLREVQAALAAGPMEARCIGAGLPPWWAGPLSARAARSGEAWVSGFLAAQHRHPPLWLRAARPAEIPALKEELAAAGLTAVEDSGAGTLAGPLAGGGLGAHWGAMRAHGKTPVDHTEAWKRGAIEIQDRGSQEAGAVVEAKPGEAVWDACAGFGGKTLQLAAMMRGKGAIHASDREERRLLGLRERALRAGFSNVRLFVWDGIAKPDFPYEVKKRGGFDHVLIDAPCSGSGTWRRRPDGRLRGRPESLVSMAAQQRALLEAVAEAPRPGGSLCYLTCSVWVEENEAVISGFLAAHPEYRLDLEKMAGCPGADSDSLYAARLIRAAPPGAGGAAEAAGAGG